MLNIYNPFKPHVVQFNNGKFGLRKYQMFTGWLYLDQTRNPEYWWHMVEHIPQYCQVSSVDKLLYPFTSKYFKE